MPDNDPVKSEIGLYTYTFPSIIIYRRLGSLKDPVNGGVAWLDDEFLEFFCISRLMIFHRFFEEQVLLF